MSNTSLEATTTTNKPTTTSSERSTDSSSVPHRVVEVATLILPSHAVQSGLEAGDGDHVVLAAAPATVEQLHLAQQQQQQQDTTTSGTEAQISAVVDLEVLSELIGISEEEFIAELHADLHGTQEQQQQEQHDGEKEQDEETPLLSIAPTTTTTTTSATTTSVADDTPSTNSKQSNEDDDDNDPHRITLAADPFIETLANALPTINESQVLPAQPQDDPTATVTVVEAGATKTDDDQHLAHDAFLLNIPTMIHHHQQGDDPSTGGGSEDHFVLALPEIMVEASLAATETSHLTLSERGMPVMLEKALSILPHGALPTDVHAVHLEAYQTEAADTTTTAPELHLDVVVQHQVPVVGYVILSFGLVALASVGAALDLQQGPSPTMKTVWRQMATSLVLLPLVIQSLRTVGMPQLTFQQWLQLPLCAMAYAYMTLAFVVALDMTTLANAFVLSNMTSLVIIAGRAVLGLPILPTEGWGAVIGFAGAAMCAQDASRTLAAQAALAAAALETNDSYRTTNHDSLLGNVVALSASFGTAFYLIVAKNLRASMDLFVFMFSVMSIGCLLLILYMMASGETFTWDMHPHHGLFGWMLWDMPDRLWLELYMAIICNVVGTTGYIAVMKYFEPIVPATVMLMEPVVGALLGVAAGTADLPGLQTWAGDVVVAVGTFCVIYSGSKSTETIDATKALRPTGGGTGSGGMDDSDVISVLKSPLIRRSLSRESASRRRPSYDSTGEQPPAKVVWDHS